MLVNDVNRAKAHAIIAKLQADSIADPHYGYAIVLSEADIDETIRMTRPGYLPRMIGLEYDGRLFNAKVALLAAADAVTGV